MGQGRDPISYQHVPCTLQFSRHVVYSLSFSTKTVMIDKFIALEEDSEAQRGPLHCVAQGPLLQEGSHCRCPGKHRGQEGAPRSCPIMVRPGLPVRISRDSLQAAAWDTSYPPIVLSFLYWCAHGWLGGALPSMHFSEGSGWGFCVKNIRRAQVQIVAHPLHSLYD